MKKEVVTKDDIIIDRFSINFLIVHIIMLGILTSRTGISIQCAQKPKKINVLEFVLQFNVLWISEVKSIADIHIPGYVTYRNIERYNNHGGIALFIKKNIKKIVKQVTYSGDDGIIIHFTNIPNVLFSGWYVPPRDSPYYDSNLFANISIQKRAEVLMDYNVPEKISPRKPNTWQILINDNYHKSYPY